MGMTVMKQLMEGLVRIDKSQLPGKYKGEEYSAISTTVYQSRLHAREGQLGS